MCVLDNPMVVFGSSKLNACIQELKFMSVLTQMVKFFSILIRGFYIHLYARSTEEVVSAKHVHRYFQLSPSVALCVLSCLHSTGVDNHPICSTCD